MNEQTVLLIQQMAERLGTTADHLWAILIRQASISAATDVLQYILIGVAVWLYVRVARKNWDNFAEIDMFFTVIVGIILVILVIVVFFCFPTTITAIVNPEYWALNRVLDTIKRK